MPDDHDGIHDEDVDPVDVAAFVNSHGLAHKLAEKFCALAAEVADEENASGGPAFTCVALVMAAEIFASAARRVMRDECRKSGMPDDATKECVKHIREVMAPNCGRKLYEDVLGKLVISAPTDPPAFTPKTISTEHES